MKYLRIIFLLFTTISLTSFGQTDSLKLNAIKRLLIASGSANNARVGIEGMLLNLKNSSASSSLPEGFWEEFKKEVNSFFFNVKYQFHDYELFNVLFISIFLFHKFNHSFID